MRAPLATIIVIIGLTLGGPPMAAADEVHIGKFQGQWRAVEATVEGDGIGIEIRPQDLNVAITAEDGGFRLRWTALQRDRASGAFARREAEARFRPTDRPGVFAYEQQPGSLLGRLFASPATGNPLTGETLLWARLDGPTLIVYSLGLTEWGGFDLHRAARSLEDGDMSVHYTIDTESRRPTVVRGRLHSAGS